MNDKFKDFKVTKLPPAGPRKGQSQNAYMNWREREAWGKFGQDEHCKLGWQRRASSLGGKNKGPKRR